MLKNKKMSAIAIALNLGAFLGLFHNVAQAKDVSSDWVKLCTKDNNNQNICTTLLNVFSATGQPLTTINIIDNNNQPLSRRLQIAVPTGRRVQEGVKLQIDNLAVHKMDYLFCVGLSCVAEGALDDTLLKNLKNGKKLMITSVNYQGISNPIQASLKGFWPAFTGAGMRASDIAAQQKSFIQELDNKEKAFTDKLKKAQDKAKKH